MIKIDYLKHHRDSIPELAKIWHEVLGKIWLPDVPISRVEKKLILKFNFKPLAQTDLNLLCQWFNKPHVLEWWQDNLTDEEIKNKYSKRIGDSIICPYIAYLNDKPFGFIQYYWASKIGDGWWPNEGENTVGLDQFIGEENFINQGYGSAMIKQFIDFLRTNNPAISKIITESHPNNLRARRCYEKVGFIEAGIIDTPDGKSILLELYI